MKVNVNESILWNSPGIQLGQIESNRNFSALNALTYKFNNPRVAMCFLRSERNTLPTTYKNYSIPHKVEGSSSFLVKAQKPGFCIINLNGLNLANDKTD